MSTTKIPTEWEIIDHGIDHSQYFQGCGVSYTKWQHAVTGCGQSAKEAFEDALENMASSGDIDVKPIEDSDDAKEWRTEAAENASVEAHLRKHGELEEDEDGEMVIPDDCELHYYVSIRWNDDTQQRKET